MSSFAQHMTAAVLYGKEHLRIETVKVPLVEPGDVLVRVRAALTCGTDVKVFRRGYHARIRSSRQPFLDTSWREISSRWAMELRISKLVSAW